MVDEQAARQLIAEHLAVAYGDVEDSTEFRDLGADSLDLITLTMRLEEAFDIHITDDQVENCRTVGEALALLRQRAGARLEPV
jgi:acyl carrier protein